MIVCAWGATKSDHSYDCMFVRLRKCERGSVRLTECMQVWVYVIDSIWGANSIVCYIII